MSYRCPLCGEPFQADDERHDYVMQDHSAAERRAFERQFAVEDTTIVAQFSR